MHVMKMCQAFVQTGHDVDLVVPGRPGTARDGDALWRHYGVRDRFPVRRVRRLPALGGWDYAARTGLFPGSPRPDILYTRILATAAVAATRGVPVVYEAHTPVLGRSGPVAFRALLRAPGFRRVVVISQALRRIFSEAWGKLLPASRLVVAHDGVDLERFDSRSSAADARASLGLPWDGVTAGYAGHFYRGRGMDLVLDVARALPDVGFLLVGGTPADLARVRADAARRGLENVAFPGFVPNGDLPRYLAACDILLMPYERHVTPDKPYDVSAWMSPMKMFEYMATGRAIVSSDIPVLREVLDESRAVLCPPGDVEAWRRELASLARDPARAAALGRAARLDVEKYTWRSRVGRVLGRVEAAA